MPSKEQPSHIYADQIFFVLAIGLKPLYLRGTGVLQISDLFLAAGFFFSLFSKMQVSYSKETDNWMLLFFICIVYQAAVNAIWAFVLPGFGIDSSGMNHFTLYYVFNYFVAWYCLNLYFSYGFGKLRQLLIMGMLLSGAIAFGGVIRNTGISIRVTGFFQNPNQLGYYAVVLLTVVIYYKAYIRNWIRYLMLVFSFVCLVASLSKAAMISSAIMLVLNILFSSESTPNRNKTWKKAILCVCGFVFLYIILFSDSSFIASNRILLAMRRRIINVGSENDSSLGVGRGYNRIFEIGPDLLWGVGEGAYNRFVSLSGVEVHSTYGNMLVCYGIIGSIGYTLVWWKALFWNAKKMVRLLAFSGILLYGITHNGIRNTLIWALLTLFFIESKDAYNNADEQENEKI